MAVAAAEAPATGARHPDRSTEARELARDHNLIPLRETFIDDCETPGLGVPEAARATGRAFLLESADQGRVGRYSFIGYRPRKVLRWSLGDPGDPYALAAAELGRVDPAPLAGPAPVRRRRRRRVRLRPRAHGRAARRAEPRPGRHPDLALMLTDALVAFDHLRHTDHGARQRLRATSDLERLVRARPRDDRRGPLAASPARCRARRGRRPGPRRRRASQSNMARERFEAIVARIIEYIYAGDAFQVVPSQRWSAPVPV